MYGGAKPRRMINVSQPNTSSTSYDLRRRRLVTSTPVPQSLSNRLTRLAGMDPGSSLRQQSMPVLEPDVLGAAGPSTPQTVTNDLLDLNESMV